MTAAWKPLAVALSVGLVLLVWPGLCRGSGISGVVSLDQDMAAVPGCSRGPSSRCMVDIRYAERAADLGVVPENIYFRNQRAVECFEEVPVAGADGPQQLVRSMK
jgi:hypothetical protein